MQLITETVTNTVQIIVEIIYMTNAALVVVQLITETVTNTAQIMVENIEHI